MQFESWSAYQERERRRREQEVAAKAPPPVEQFQPPDQGLPGPLQGLASGIEAVAASPVVQGPLNVLHNLTRPAGAVRGFLGTPEDRLGGAGTGFVNPEQAPSGFQLNQQAGINLPQENIGPLPFSPADLAGRATEIGLDPLSYVPGVGWAGKGAGILGTGVKLTAPFAADLAAAPFRAANLLRRPGATLAEIAAQPGPEKLSVGEALAENAMGTLGRQLPRIPKIEDLVGPALRDSGEDIASVIHANARTVDANQRWVDSYAAIFESYPVPKQVRDAIEEAGELLTTVGTAVTAMPGANYRAFTRPSEVLGGDLSMGRTPFGFGGPYEIEIAPGGRGRISLGAGHPGESRGEVEASRVTRVFYDPDEWSAESRTARLAADLPQLRAMFPQAEFVRIKLADDARTRIAMSAERGSDALSSLTPDEQTLAGIVQERIAQLAGRYQRTYNALDEKAPEWAKSYLIEFKKNYMPGYIEQVDEETGRRMRVPVTARKTFQFEKEFETHAIGEAQGQGYLDASAELALHFRDMGSKITEMETLITLLPYAKYVQDAEHPALSAARTTTGLREIPLAHLKGVWFDPKDAAQITKGLTSEKNFAEGTGVGSSLGRVATTVGQLRSVQASGDLSNTFLQNMVMLATHPHIGLATIIKGLQALGDTTINARTLAEPWAQQTINLHPNLHIGSTEFTTGVRMVNAAAEKIGSVPVLGGVGRGAQQVLNRTQGAWDTMGNVSRLYAAEALKGLSADPMVAAQIDAVLNHMTGVISTHAMGVSPGRRALETGILFAPNFMRASLALIGDLLGAPVARSEALNAISKLMVSGAWMYSHLTEAADQPAIYDPADARFMTMNIAGQRVGVGGTYRGLANLLGKVAAHPDGMLDWRVFDPENTNPLLRFWRGRASVPLSKVWDIASHETFLGTPIDDNFGDVAKWAGTSLLPFSIAGLFTERGDPASQAIGLGAQATGLRAFPEGVKDVRERVAMKPEYGGKPFDELGVVEQARVMNSPEVKALPAAQGRRFEGQRRVSSYFDQYANGLPDPEDPRRLKIQGVNQLAGQVAAGAMSHSDFRVAVSSLQERLGTLLDQEKPGGKPPTTQAQADRVKYQALLGRLDENNQPDYDAAESFLRSLPQDSQDFIAQKHLAFLEQLDSPARDLMKDLTQARDHLRPYREILKTSLTRVGLWDQYVNANPVEQDKLRETPRYKMAARLTRAKKDEMRLKDPTIDAELVTWYGEVPIRKRRR